jgi:hypothetical protein
MIMSTIEYLAVGIRHCQDRTIDDRRTKRFQTVVSSRKEQGAVLISYWPLLNITAVLNWKF